MGLCNFLDFILKILPKLDLLYIYSTAKRQNGKVYPFPHGNDSHNLGMEHFNIYLRRKHFTMLSDHKPLETSGNKHERTLSRKHSCNGILELSTKRI
jgi:hypothetical protein